MGLSGSFGHIRALPACRRGQSAYIPTLSEFHLVQMGRGLGVVGFIRAYAGGRPVHSGAPWVSLGSFRQALGVVGFIRVGGVRRRGRRVNSGSFGRAPCGRKVHTGAHRGSLGFVVFIRASPGGQRVNAGVPWGSLGSLWP